MPHHVLYHVNISLLVCPYVFVPYVSVSRNERNCNQCLHPFVLGTLMRRGSFVSGQLFQSWDQCPSPQQIVL